MSYFSNVKFVPYKFGNSKEFTLHQNLGSYVDLVDQVRDNNSFYQKYTILEGDRPDALSYKLYGSTKYYWTFYLMNEKLRENGWPTETREIIRLVKTRRPNTVLTSTSDLNGIFLVGDIVTGQTSGESGKIIKRNLDLGQIFVEGNKNFLTNEIVTTNNSIISTAQLVSATEEYNATWRYEVDNKPVDIDPQTGPGSEVVAVTYTDKYVRENNDLRDIVVIKPSVIGSVYEQFQGAMSL